MSTQLTELQGNKTSHLFFTIIWACPGTRIWEMFVKSLHQYALNVEKRGMRQKRTLLVSVSSMGGVLADFYSFTPVFGILYKHWFSNGYCIYI